MLADGNATPRRGKILVIRGGAIGDFILTLPVLRALREQFPNAGLEVLGYPHIAELARAARLVDQVKAIEGRGLASFFARGGKLDDELAAYFAEFNVIVSYLYDPDLIFQTNVCQCTTAQFIEGPHRPDESLDLHATQVFLKPLEMLAIFEADPVPRLPIPRQPAAIHRLGIHPGSGSERKNWPETRWAELLGRLAEETSWEFLLAGGEAEGERLGRLRRALPGFRLHMAQSMKLVELAGQLQRCRLFLGHDSGISHLAAALGLPGLVLWGPSRQAIWRPASDSFRVLGASSINQIQVADVMEELRGLAVLND